MNNADIILGIFANVGRTLATIRETSTGETWRIYRHHGGSAPACISGSNTVCGYWESRFELFDWACDEIEADPFTCEWIDGFTGEILDYDDLETEFFDLMEV